MSTHRSTQHLSVVPKNFDWRRVTPDLLTMIAALNGMMLGVMVVLFLLLAVFPNLVAVALLAALAWVVASAAYIWLQGHNGSH